MASLDLGLGTGLESNSSWAIKSAADFDLTDLFRDEGRRGTAGRCASGLVGSLGRGLGSGDDDYTQEKIGVDNNEMFYTERSGSQHLTRITLLNKTLLH